MAEKGDEGPIQRRECVQNMHCSREIREFDGSQWMSSFKSMISCILMSLLDEIQLGEKRSCLSEVRDSCHHVCARV